MSKILLIFLGAVAVATAQESTENFEGQSVRQPRGIFGRDSGLSSLPGAMFAAAANTASALSGIAKGKVRGSQGHQEEPAEANGYYELIEVKPGNGEANELPHSIGGSKGNDVFKRTDESKEDKKSNGERDSEDSNRGGSWSGKSDDSSADKKEPSISSRIVGQSVRLLGEAQQSTIEGPSYEIDSGKHDHVHYASAPHQVRQHASAPHHVRQHASAPHHVRQHASAPHHVRQHASAPIYHHGPVHDAPPCVHCPQAPVHHAPAPVHHAPPCVQCPPAPVHYAPPPVHYVPAPQPHVYEQPPQIEYVHIEHPSKIHETVVEHIIEHPPQIIEKTKHTVERVPHVFVARQSQEKTKLGKKW